MKRRTVLGMIFALLPAAVVAKLPVSPRKTVLGIDQAGKVDSTVTARVTMVRTPNGLRPMYDEIAPIPEASWGLVPSRSQVKETAAGSFLRYGALE